MSKTPVPPPPESAPLPIVPVPKKSGSGEHPLDQLLQQRLESFDTRTMSVLEKMSERLEGIISNAPGALEPQPPFESEWTITIRGRGPHHNADDVKDAKELDLNRDLPKDGPHHRRRGVEQRQPREHRVRTGLEERRQVMLKTWSTLLASRKMWVGLLTIVSVLGSLYLRAKDLIPSDAMVPTILSFSATGLSIIGSIAWEDASAKGAGGADAPPPAPGVASAVEVNVDRQAGVPTPVVTYAKKS